MFLYFKIEKGRLQELRNTVLSLSQYSSNYDGCTAGFEKMQMEKWKKRIWHCTVGESECVCVEQSIVSWFHYKLTTEMSSWTPAKFWSSRIQILKDLADAFSSQTVAASCLGCALWCSAVTNMVGEVVYFPWKKKTNKQTNKKIMITVETFSCAGIEISVNSEHLPYNFIHHRYLRLYGSSFRWNLNFLENVWEQTKYVLHSAF